MSFPPTPTIEQAAKDNQLALLMRAHMVQDQTDESFDFYFSKESNQAIYNKYVRVDAPREVNLPESIRKQMDVLAKNSQWKLMNEPLKQARKHVGHMVNRDVMGRFLKNENYIRYCVNKYKRPTDAGARAITLLTPELAYKKDLSKLKALMLIVEGGRTPNDRYQAYKAIQGLLKNPAQAAVHFAAAKLAVPK